MVNNSIGSGGSSVGGSVINSIGGGSSGSTTVSNAIGQSVAGGGAVVNSLGGGTGRSTNSFGAVSGAGSAVNNIGTTTTAGSTAVNNIGTGLGATTNNFGNAQAATTINMAAGHSLLSMSNNVTSLTGGSPLATNGTSGTTSSIGSGGLTIYNSAQTVAPNTTIANSLNGAAYQNRINGNLLVDGNVYINGTLNYVSANSANTSVIGSIAGIGRSVLQNASTSTAGNLALAMNGSATSHTEVDNNGKLTTVNGVVPESSVSLTLTNGVGNTHGMLVTESQTTIAGGTQSSSLTLNDQGATFSNSENGQPVQVHGVADGTASKDAVNYHQLRQVMAGVAGTAAMANIPNVDSGKTFSIGAGIGVYQSSTAVAVGASYRAFPSTVFRASISTVSGAGQKNTVMGVGAGMSW